MSTASNPRALVRTSPIHVANSAPPLKAFGQQAKQQATTQTPPQPQHPLDAWREYTPGVRTFILVQIG